ncbi:MAG: D-alanyl-D-alanine carboxypeptidase [Rhodospirillales bacterium]|nr:D-alanyl-D-alanine carboxypeptidase [Rhodospirillales bacterium]
MTSGGLYALVRRCVPFAAAVVFLSLFIFVNPRPALADYAALVMDAETGRVLHAKNADVPNHPASLTKMMTLYMVFERLQQGRITLNTRWEASAHAVAQAPSKLGFREGDTLSVHDVILGLVTKSANDAAALAAEALGGTEENFANAMTQKARRLGMANTVFRNASGLPHPGQITTARDMATLARALHRQFPQYYTFFSTEEFTYAGATHRNHNNLLFTYEGADGIKTGWIRASGYNLVASATRDGRRVIGVVLGGHTSKARNVRMAELLDKGFEAVATQTVVQDTPARPAGRQAKQTATQTKQTAQVKHAAPAATSPAATASTNESQPWGIQIGAFKRQSDAKAAAERALAMLAPVIDDAEVVVLQSQKKGGRDMLYRARIHGISKTEASKACRLLHKKKMGCMEVQVANGTELAAARG